MKIIKKVNVSQTERIVNFLAKFDEISHESDFLGSWIADFSSNVNAVNNLLEKEWNTSEAKESLEIEDYTGRFIKDVQYFDMALATRQLKIYLLATLSNKLVIVRVRNFGEDDYQGIYIGYEGGLNDFYTLMSSMHITRPSVEEYYVVEGMSDVFNNACGMKKEVTIFDIEQ